STQDLVPFRIADFGLRIKNPCLSIRNRQSAIVSPQSAIVSPQSAIVNPLLHRLESLLHLNAVAFFSVSNLILQIFRCRGQQAKTDVCRLEMSRVREGNVVHEAAAGRDPGRNGGFEPLRHAARVDSRQQTGGDGFYVTLDSADLSGKKEPGILSGLQRRPEKLRRLDIRIPVNLSEAEKFRLLESGNQPEHALLFGEFEMVLEADKVVTVGHQIFQA